MYSFQPSPHASPPHASPPPSMAGAVLYLERSDGLAVGLVKVKSPAANRNLISGLGASSGRFRGEVFSGRKGRLGISKPWSSALKGGARSWKFPYLGFRGGFPFWKLLERIHTDSKPLGCPSSQPQVARVLI